jgi:hypothetical protein
MGMGRSLMPFEVFLADLSCCAANLFFVATGDLVKLLFLVGNSTVMDANSNAL